jgi:uncharacterized membrane protein
VKNRFYLFAFLLTLVITAYNVGSATAQSPIVRAVLFFSPECSHCHEVINQILPPIKAKFQEQLDIVGIDVTPDAGQNLYQSAVTRYNIPDDRIGIPTLIVGDVILVGSDEIAAQFASLVEKGLSAGGTDWPDFPGLKEALDAQPISDQTISTNTPPQMQVSDNVPKFFQKFNQDPIANTIAIIVLIGMVASVIGVAYLFIKENAGFLPSGSKWIIPLLSVIGLGIAIYLSYIEITRSKAICGPVGNCNSVQESSYARLFGLLPVGVLGALGYLAILGAWIVQQYGPKTWHNTSALVIWGMAWFGILFSIYLTFLEPFVIGATCAWCITSAIVMSLLFWVSTGPAKKAWNIDDELNDSDGIEVESTL